MSLLCDLFYYHKGWTVKDSIIALRSEALLGYWSCNISCIWLSHCINYLIDWIIQTRLCTLGNWHFSFQRYWRLRSNFKYIFWNLTLIHLIRIFLYLNKNWLALKVSLGRYFLRAISLCDYSTLHLTSSKNSIKVRNGDATISRLFCITIRIWWVRSLAILLSVLTYNSSTLLWCEILLVIDFHSGLWSRIFVLWPIKIGINI